MSQAARARQMVLAVELNEAELACRMLEAAMGRKRPIGVTAIEALETQQPELREEFLLMAKAAVRYFHEQVNAGASVT